MSSDLKLASRGVFRLVTRRPSTFIVALVLLAQLQLRADQISFEGLNSLEPVTTQFHGLIFSNTIILTAGISLNEVDFPPRSGVNVASDDGGPITILFSSPILSFFGYFTYIMPLSVEAFDSANFSVAFATSLFSANDGFTGEVESSPNELIGVSFAAGFSTIVIAGDALGSSFMMDDVSFESTVPEPATGLIIATALAGLICWSRWRAKHYQP